MKITSTLNDLTLQLLQDNLKRSKRQLSRYHHDEWTVAEEISKSLVPKLKNFKMEATQVITVYYKVAEISRTHGRGATELFEQLVSIKEGDLSVEQKNQLFDEAVENARSLAVFAWAQPRQQYDDAAAYVTEALRLPQSLKHLERPKDSELSVTIHVREPKKSQGKSTKLGCNQDDSELCAVQALEKIINKTKTLQSSLSEDHTLFLTHLDSKQTPSRSVRPSTVAN